jgi:hypothetical protein
MKPPSHEQAAQVTAARVLVGKQRLLRRMRDPHRRGTIVMEHVSGKSRCHRVRARHRRALAGPA